MEHLNNSTSSGTALDGPFSWVWGKLVVAAYSRWLEWPLHHVVGTLNLMMKTLVSLRGWCGRIQWSSGKKSPGKNLHHFLLWQKSVPSLCLCQGLFKPQEQAMSRKGTHKLDSWTVGNCRKCHTYRACPAQLCMIPCFWNNVRNFFAQKRIGTSSLFEPYVI